MPDLSAHLPTFLRGGFSMHGYISTITEVSVMEGTVTADAADQATTLSFTLTSGSAASVVAGMEVVILTSGSVFKGRLRVADGGSTSTVLQVNEFSPGRLKVVTGDKLKVMRSFRLRDLLVAQTTFNKDTRIAYSNQNALIKPIANTGGLYVGGVAGGIVAVQHFGSLSSTLDPDSGASGTHLWDAKDGTITVGTSTSADITAEYGAGSRVIDYQFTDSSNSTSAKKYTLVRTHDENDPPIPLTGRPRLSGSRRDGGYTMTFTAVSGCGIEALPDGALVVFWKDEKRGSSSGSYGSKVTGRSHIKFVGFLLRETIRVDVRTNTVTFEAVSPQQLLKLMTGFSQVLEEVSSPTTWQQYKGLTVKQMVVYLLRWHTTALDIFDLIWNITTNYPYPRFFIQQSTPGAQVQEILDGISARFCVDRTGRMEVNKLLSRSTTAERNAATTALALSTSLIVPPRELAWEHRYTTAQVEGKGFTTGTTPLKSVAPGEAPAEAADYTTIERLIVIDQAELNRVTGHVFAEKNSLYDGLPVPKGMPVKLRPGLDVFDVAYEDWVTDTLDSASNARGRGFSADRFLIDRIEVQYDETTGVDETVLYLDHETRGEPGQTRAVQPSTDVPPETGGGNPVFTNPSVNVGRGTLKLAYICSNGYLWLTSDGGLTYTGYNLSPTGTLDDGVWNPHVTATVDLLLLTTTRIYTLADIASARTLTSRHSWSITGSGTLGRIEIERAQPNFAAAVQTAAPTVTRLARTTTLTSWAETLVNNDGSSNAATGLYVSGKRQNTLYVSESKTASGATDGKVSTNAGVSLADSTVLNFDSLSAAHAMHVPYDRNPNEDLAFFSRIASTTDTRLYRTQAGVQTDISYNDGGKHYAQFPRAIDTFPLNRDIVWAALRRNSTGSSDATVAAVSSNGGNSFTPIPGTAGTVGSGYITGVRCAGDDPNIAYLFGFGGRIYKTVDRGASVIDLSITDPNVGRILNVFGWG
jgi:hypothetical protein